MTTSSFHMFSNTCSQTRIKVDKEEQMGINMSFLCFEEISSYFWNDMMHRNSLCLHIFSAASHHLDLPRPGIYHAREEGNLLLNHSCSRHLSVTLHSLFISTSVTTQAGDHHLQYNLPVMQTLHQLNQEFITECILHNYDQRASQP